MVAKPWGPGVKWPEMGDQHLTLYMVLCQFNQCLLSIADQDTYRVHTDIYEDPWRVAAAAAKSHALEDGFLTTGLPGKSCISFSVRSVTKPSLYIQ